VLRQLFAGEEAKVVAASCGYAVPSVNRLFRETGGLRPRTRPRSPLRLSATEREEISRGISGEESLRSISRRLRRSASTISREVAHNGGRCQYRAWWADECAIRRGRRPKQTKLGRHARLRSAVVKMLEGRYSPEQISETLKREYPEDSGMQVSHEAIYRSLFIQGRGALRKELAKCLRTGRAHRIPHARGAAQDRFGTMLSISERPAEADDRAVPGHWEGDLLVGKNNSAIGTLVERSSRFVMLFDLPEGRTAERVREALTKKILTLPEALRRSLTWDRGAEMAQHARFTVDTNVQVYFCDPHSPWQRGSNENTNGLLRQYFPKGTNLKAFGPKELDAVAAQLNDRPRQTLGWMRPSEFLAQALR
jgi:IS30 family transposase